jgi:hypothetical protein
MPTHMFCVIAFSAGSCKEQVSCRGPLLLFFQEHDSEAESSATAAADADAEPLASAAADADAAPLASAAADAEAESLANAAADADAESLASAAADAEAESLANAAADVGAQVRKILAQLPQVRHATAVITNAPGPQRRLSVLAERACQPSYACCAVWA